MIDFYLCIDTGESPHVYFCQPMHDIPGDKSMYMHSDQRYTSCSNQSKFILDQDWSLIPHDISLLLFIGLCCFTVVIMLSLNLILSLFENYNVSITEI